MSYEAAAAGYALLCFSIFVVAGAKYVSTCEECHVLAKKCKSYERQMKSRNNPSIDEMVAMKGIVQQAYGQFQHRRFMRSVFFVTQVLMGMSVLGALIFMIVRAM